MNEFTEGRNCLFVIVIENGQNFPVVVEDATKTCAKNAGALV